MNGPGHRWLGATVTLGAALYLRWSPAETLLAAPLGVLMASGPTSPDIDQTHGWHTFTRQVGLWPSWRRHRGVTHWWGWAALAATELLRHYPDDRLLWLPLAIICGWSSHLLGDFLIGSPGIPLLPNGPHVGLRFLRAGGATERALVWGLFPLLFFVELNLIWWHPEQLAFLRRTY